MDAGRMLGFFAELGFIFPQFPFIAHSRGWSPEDMENNVAMERNSKELADGACMLAKRLLDLAARLIAQDEAPASIERGAARPIWCRWGGDAREAYIGPRSRGSQASRRMVANFVAWSNFNSVSAVRLMATPRCAGGQVSALHCQEIAAELTFRN